MGYWFTYDLAWQASLGASVDGIMTEELLERLYVEQKIEGSGSNLSADEKDSPTDTSKVYQSHS